MIWADDQEGNVQLWRSLGLLPRGAWTECRRWFTRLYNACPTSAVSDFSQHFPWAASTSLPMT
jgi:hypothetical protein